MASLYISRYSGGWRVIEESYKSGKRKQVTVPKEAYTSLGVNPKWTVEQAKTRIDEINASDELKSKKITAAKNVKLKLVHDSIYLPIELVQSFDKDLREDSFGSEKHKLRLVSHWNALTKLIRHLKIEPTDYYNNREQIYKYFILHQYSPDYVNKLIRIFNLWGEHVCQYRKQFFKPVPKPRGQVLQKVEESYQDSDKKKNESDPLTFEMLRSKASQFQLSSNVNWLYLSICLGARPLEVDSLHDKKRYRISEENGVPVLFIYQSKLTSIAREKRWKPIPLLYPEQVLALDIIKSGEFKRPLMKTENRIFTENRLTLHGGRKGFLDLMLDRGQVLEDVSIWLGHQSIETTWRKYRNRKRVSWKAS